MPIAVAMANNLDKIMRTVGFECENVRFSFCCSTIIYPYIRNDNILIDFHYISNSPTMFTTYVQNY